MRDEQFVFRLGYGTSLHLAHLRNFGEKRLTGSIFLDVIKAIYTVWIDGLLYNLTILNFP